tara:strand:- start:720 stop:914 length:195 start_codon:yes stop_codon:yes gene_type:complete
MGVCSKCKSIKLLVIGIIILVTAMYYSTYIWHVIGGIFILKGILFLAKPAGCDCGPTTTKGKKK